MKYLMLTILVASMCMSCSNHNTATVNNTSGGHTGQLPYITFQKEQLFPGDSSLSRPEDGVALADGRVIVADQAKGLRIIETDGTTQPFGDFAGAGFSNNAEVGAAPNGVFLERDGQHILMCDIGDGKIYRVELATGKVNLLHDHPFGVNAVYRDKTGAIWFSQSDDNPDTKGPSADPDFRLPKGAIFRMADLNSKPTKVIDSLYMANGLVMDEKETTIYVAETMMNRVLSFTVDIGSGNVTNPDVAAIVIAPDNITMDSKGRLIIASPGSNRVIAADLSNHSQHVIFDASTPSTRKVANEWFRNSQTSSPRGRLISAKMYKPLPGLLTGMFFSQDGQTLYVTNLGRDIVKIDFK